MFANLFKPKWRHSDPDVRASAVAKLSSDQPEQLMILRELALSDSSSRVRITAIQRISDTDFLLQLLSSASDPEVLEQAGQRVGECLDENSNEDSICQLLKQINNDSARTQIILNTNGLKPDSLNQIDDESLLMQLALHARVADTRKAAVTRLHDTDLLEQVQRASRGRDKAVHRICRDKLNSLREQARQEAESEQRRQQLIHQLHQLLLTDDTQFLQARAQAAYQEWKSLTQRDDELHARFLELSQQLDLRLQRQAEKEAAEAEAQARREQQLETAHSLVHRLSNLQPTQDDTEQVLEEVEQAWQALVADFLPQTLKQQKNSLSQQLQAAATANQRLEAQSEAIQTLLADTQSSPKKLLDKAQSLLIQIDWPTQLSQPEPLQQLKNRMSELRQTISQIKQDAREHSDQLNTQLDQLEQLIEQGNVVDADKLNAKLRESLGNLASALPDSIENRHRLLNARLAELRDWQGFAAAGKKEALCGQMEALVGVEMEPQALADKIRTLQQEWKQVDATDPVHSQKLWKRFHEAGEKAYEPCQAWFGGQRKKREYNLEQRRQICEQLSLYIEQMNWEQADWHAVEAVSRTARDEWRQFSPVDRAPGKPLQQTFNTLLRDLDNRIKSFRQQCGEAKEALIARAAELAQLEDVQAAAEGAKELQREWKASGPTFRSRERALWQAFRGHCDTIFDRLKNERQVQAKAEKAAAKTQRAQETLDNHSLEALEQLDKLASQTEEELANEGNSDTLATLLTQAITGRSPGTQWRERMSQRLEAIRLISSGARSIEEQLGLTERQARELCIRLEILLGVPSPESDEALRMEYQMERLSQALEQQDCEPTPAALQALNLEWLTLPYYWHFTDLRQRFENLLEQV